VGRHPAEHDDAARSRSRCRFRLDGTSEIEGIAPDVELDFAGDGWLDSLVQVLARTPAPR
jgi:hypothetical protein